MSVSSSSLSNQPRQRRKGVVGTELGGGNDLVGGLAKEAAASNGTAATFNMPVTPASPSPVVIHLVLPHIPEGCRAMVRMTAEGLEVAVERAKVGFSIEEACKLLPNAPRPDTLKARFENAGIALGQVGRTPLVSYEQLVAALRLTA